MRKLPALRLLCVFVVVMLGYWPKALSNSTLPAAPSRLTPADLCGDDVACLSLRWMPVDPASLRVLEPDLGELNLPGASDQPWAGYDLGRLLRPISRAQLAREPEESLAFRLVMAEVGPQRLLTGRNGLKEAMAVLQVVFNRLDRQVGDPYPGCGPEGDFVSCANPQQFLGLRSERALDPGAQIAAQDLLRVTDRVMLAWLLVRSGAAPDLTGGATEFIHRCGGKAYGQKTTACDEVSEWKQGNNPLLGPLVLRAPKGQGPGRRDTAVLHWRPLN